MLKSLEGGCKAFPVQRASPQNPTGLLLAAFPHTLGAAREVWESVQNCWSAKHSRLGTGPHLPRYHSPSAWEIARVLLYLFRYQPSANVLARFSFAASPVCQICGPQFADAPFFTPPRRLSTLFFPNNVSYRYSFLTIVPFELKTPKFFYTS